MHEIDPDQKGKRLLLLLPLAIYILASLALVVASFDARGVASVIDYDRDAPLRAGLFFAVPPLVIAPILARGLWRTTSRLREVAPSRLVIWLAGIAVGVALTVAYIVSVGDVASYRTIDSRGLPQPVSAMSRASSASA